MRKIFSFIISILIMMSFTLNSKTIDVKAAELNNLNSELTNVELLGNELTNYLNIYEDELILCEENIYDFNLFDEASQYETNNNARSISERKQYFFPVYYNPYTGEYIGFYLYYYDDEIFTPNGFSIDTIRHDSEIPDEYIEIFDEQIDSSSMNVERIQSASAYYNCHSYAWYSQNRTNNKMWIDYPDQYYDTLDQSYIRVYEPQENDIICYYDMNLEEGKRNLHSGIITEVLDVEPDSSVYGTNKYIVESKWGYNGFFSHAGDQCPYMPNFDGTTTEVRYYRPRTNNSYNLSGTMSELNISRTINGNGTTIDKYGMYELNVSGTNFYSITIQSSYELDNKLYNKNMGLKSMTLLSSNSNVYNYLVSLSTGTYYLRTAFSNLSNSGTISISIEKHAHSYTDWVYHDRISHIESCVCGLIGTKTEAHMISQADLFKPKARCLGCNALLDMGGNGDIGMVPGILSTGVNIITENGSYILPNGIIVLVEEDIEAYFAGTLIFYDEDETLVTQ